MTKLEGIKEENMIETSDTVPITQSSGLKRNLSTVSTEIRLGSGNQTRQHLQFNDHIEEFENTDMEAMEDEEYVTTCFCCKIRKNLRCAVILNIIGGILFVLGIFLVLWNKQSNTSNSLIDSNNVQFNNNNSDIYLLATAMATLGGFLLISGTAWYCFVRKNLVRRQPDTHIVIASEYDSKEPQTIFTEIENFSTVYSPNNSTMETTPFVGERQKSYSKAQELRRSVLERANEEHARN